MQRYHFLQAIHLLRYIILGLQVIVPHQKVFEVLYLMGLHQFHLIQHHLRLDLRLQFSLQVQHLRDCRGMSDVESALTPPELPLRDPPRMAGSYGVSLNDPVFGVSSGSIPCKNPGHRPTPAQTPIPPPPPQQGAGDPVAQLLVGQGAMSHLLIQMAQEMSRRTGGQGAGDSSQVSGQGSTSGGRKEMKMDEKWIPSMPIASWKNWTSRGKELSGFKSWLEQFSGWLCLIHDAYGPELREAINSADSNHSFWDHDQTMRSKRLFICFSRTLQNTARLRT